MTKEFKSVPAYRKVDKTKPTEQNTVYADYLAHYGVKGQKWGVRQWQNEDGTFTEAGKHRYGWGYGRQTNPSSTPTSPSGIPRQRVGVQTTGYSRRTKRNPQYSSRHRQVQPAQHQPTPEEIEARKARTRKILAIAAGVVVAAGLTYAAYRGSTKLRDAMRNEVFKRFDSNPNNVHTLHSKYWTSQDRNTYSQMTRDRARMVADHMTRRDAIAAKIQDKTGIRVKVPQSRAKFLEQRRSEISYSNFIRDAEKRGHLNRSIHDARADLRAAQRKLSSYSNTPHIGTSKKYEALWEERYAKQVKESRERLANLLERRRAG